MHGHQQQEIKQVAFAGSADAGATCDPAVDGNTLTIVPSDLWHLLRVTIAESVCQQRATRQIAASSAAAMVPHGNTYRGRSGRRRRA